MKTRIKKVPATTNNITRGIVNFLNDKGHCAFRVNTGGVFDPVTKQRRKVAKDSLGVSDIICCMKGGLFYGFEIKNEGTKDKLGNAQKVFMLRVLRSGGRSVIVSSYKQFITWYTLEYGITSN